MQKLEFISLILLFFVVSLVHANNILLGEKGSIVPDRSLFTRVSETGTVFEITGGEKRGTNLFHSFDRFSVQTGSTAKFSTNKPGTIKNIISRVTGNIRSEIDGIIKANATSGFDNVNFFLLNPAGITLGSGAELQIEGSVHFSTADFIDFETDINFEGDKTFYASLDLESSLTTTDIKAFGFLENKQPSSILVEGSSLAVENGETLSLVGGDIMIKGKGITASGGKINIISAAKGEKIPFDTSPTVRVFEEQTNKNFGEISIIAGPARGRTPNPAIISVSSKNEDGGSIYIRGGIITIDQSRVLGRNTGGGNAGTIMLDAGVLSMKNGADIDVGASGGGIAGNVSITASTSVELQGKGFVTGSGRRSSPTSISANNTGSKVAGNIVIGTPVLDVLQEAEISTRSSGEGSAGSINLNVENLTLQDGGEIVASTTNIGAGGIIEIRGYRGKETAKNVSIKDGLISTNTVFTAAAGDIEIHAKNVTVENQGTITSTTNNQGQGGNITITDTQLVDVKGKVTTGTTGNLANAGNGGNIILQTEKLLVQQGGIISSQTSNDGNAGNITIIAKDSVVLSNRGTISNESTGVGNAGNIEFKISSLQLDTSSITTAAKLSDGGNITIEGNSPAKLVSLNNDSAITATVGGGAQTTGGNINIDSDLIVVQNSNIIAEASEGTGGNIDIKTQGLFVDPDSRISASSELGVDGTVEIDSDIEVLDGVLGLPETYMSNLRLRQKRCAQRLGGGKTSSFTTLEKSGMAITPETFLSGDYSTFSNSKAHLSKAAREIKSLVSLNEQYDFNCRN